MKSRFDTLSPKDALIARMDKSRKSTEDTAVKLLQDYDKNKSRVETYPVLVAFFNAVRQLDQSGFFEKSPDTLLNKDLVLEALKAAREMFGKLDYHELDKARITKESQTQWEEKHQPAQGQIDELITKLGAYGAVES